VGKTNTPKPRPLLTVHAAVVLLIGLILGAAAGALTLAGTANLPLSALAGLSALLTGTRWAHHLIE
jgi:hypothetical protein